MKANEKSIPIIALVNSETYKAFKKGQAVSNNGLRSKQGNFWPSQPEYVDSDQYNTEVENKQIRNYIVERLFEEVGLPLIKTGINDFVLPIIKNKLSKDKKSDENHKHLAQIKARPLPNNVIDIEHYKNQNRKIG